MPKTVGVAVSNATFHFDKLYTYAVMPDQQDTVRLGSMVLVISYAILVSVFKGLWPAGVWAIALALIAIWRHWGNLQRLKNGTERKIGQKEEKKA